MNNISQTSYNINVQYGVEADFERLRVIEDEKLFMQVYTFCQGGVGFETGPHIIRYDKKLVPTATM